MHSRSRFGRAARTSSTSTRAAVEPRRCRWSPFPAASPDWPPSRRLFARCAIWRCASSHLFRSSAAAWRSNSPPLVTARNEAAEPGSQHPLRMSSMTRFLHTMVRITDPAKSRAFYEALGFTFAGDFDIVRDGQVEATNYFFSLGDQESVLELTYNHDGRSYDLGSGYGHIAVGVDDLDSTLERLAQQGIEPERPPYSVREGGSRLCFVQDPDGYRIELIGRS